MFYCRLHLHQYSIHLFDLVGKGALIFCFFSLGETQLHFTSVSTFHAVMNSAGCPARGCCFRSKMNICLRKTVRILKINLIWKTGYLKFKLCLLRLSRTTRTLRCNVSGDDWRNLEDDIVTSNSWSFLVGIQF